ncbi:hypothetical protein MMYC01_209927 [Madurella mycetomatis]|uniref:Uncharacterized protein n=1 Tax=Madurella mycetomatis TaxID=100816 RepID=A0A175VQ25_9PEZI|nr:hypothetical protein MMYC01_209927 [Madurella mycetomatis]
MAGQTSIDTHPARAPEGKTSGKPGYRSSPLSIQPQREANDRHLCRQSESKKGPHCRVPRISFINPGNTKEDNYYRNDSLKYCRHEEKKRKESRKDGRGWPVHVCNFAAAHFFLGSTPQSSAQILLVKWTAAFCRPLFSRHHSALRRFCWLSGPQHSAAQDRQSFFT